eukprot:PhF_6_TR19249/c0_g1_i1/m.28297
MVDMTSFVIDLGPAADTDDPLALTTTTSSSSSNSLSTMLAKAKKYIIRTFECFYRGVFPREVLRPHLGKRVILDAQFERVTVRVLEDIASLREGDVVVVLRPNHTTFETSGRREVENSKVAAYKEEQALSNKIVLRKAEEEDVAAVARECVRQNVTMLPAASRQLLGGHGSLALHGTYLKPADWRP